MAQIQLNIPLIRDGKSKDFVSYLNELRQNQSDITICQSLLRAVDHEYLPPQIFSVFLSWSKSLDTIALCIHEGPSHFIRKQGIKQFGKALADPEEWESAWTAIGGTRSLINIFASISVTEVTTFARAIGRCNHGQHRVGGREQAIEELLHALLPPHYPGSTFQTHDKRPIEYHYAQMVPACSPEFVTQLLDTQDQSNPLYRRLPSARLIKAHGKLLQKRVTECMFGDGCEDGHLDQYLSAFVYSQPSRPGPNPRTSASMAFATKVLQSRLGDVNNKRWPTTISEADIFISLLHRSLKRRLPEPSLHNVFMLGLHLLEAKPKLKTMFQSKGLWSKLATRWKRAPGFYEDLLSIALRLDLGGSQKTIGQAFFQTSRAVQAQPELRWPLLRLYCLHVPKKGIDIDTVDDFEPLAKQPWSSSDIFYHLSKDQAVRLLKSLYNANPKYSFLRGPARSSILSNQDIKSQQNFNVVLLLTLLQRDAEETQGKAERAVDELRKKAATAREQLDRAHFANAASNYAIASGSLDLYGETITWQQRFVRDPLTLKVIFGRDAVMTSEGIELLSGIPQPLPEDIALDEIASRVEKANDLLMTFHETMRIAKREPSFQQADWAGVTSLFGAAIGKRVDLTKDIHKHLSPEADVYTAIWAGTLAMLEKVNVHSLNQAYRPIKSLLDTLPPTALATTTKAMIETGNERRKKQDRQPGEVILERLSYEVLKRLAVGDKPQLAQQLVLRTILDRPDASSWHRQLLSISFMKSLPAKEAQEMLLAFATAIGEKLEEQSYFRVGEAQPPKSAPPKSAPPQSLVKVTTVKYLAQLLDNAEFISAEAAMEVLVELFKAGTHRDIRLATLDSLLSLLNNLCSGAGEEWRSNPLVEKIMGALETVILVVGSINERRPPRLEDWAEAKETGTLPETSDISAGLPPLLSAIFTAPDGRQYPGLKHMEAEFVARFLLPILEHSQAEHRKWVALFLAKHKVNLAVDDLPPTPISPEVWDTLVSLYPDFIPQTVLEDFNKHIILTVAPPTTLKDFNNSLRKNNDLSNTPEVQHWLSVFGQTMDRYFSSGSQTLLAIINRDKPNPLVRNGITFPEVLDMVLSHASLFLDNYEEKYTEVWNDFIRDMRHPTKGTYPVTDDASLRAMVSQWQQSGKIVLEKVTALVVEKKNEYSRDQNRRILPSATRLRLWLLPYPCFPPAAEVDVQFKAFVVKMEGLLDSFLEGEANVLRWPQIADGAFAVSEMLNTDEERLRVALYIGKLADNAGEQRTAAMNFVRVAVAMKLIEDGRDGLKKSGKGTVADERKEIVRRIRDRIGEWQGGDDESIREKVGEWRRKQRSLWESLISAEEVAITSPNTFREYAYDKDFVMSPSNVDGRRGPGLDYTPELEMEEAEDSEII
jgi:hypothetical protein